MGAQKGGQQCPDYSDYTVKWASLPWEVEQAYQLRRRVFCEEQGMFEHDDRDAIDESAQLLVVLGNYGGWHQEVVGTVRIHQQRDGHWTGSRLAVDQAFRTQGQLGAGLIRLAVSSARALGCRRFTARVQERNELLFRRLHWHTRDYCHVSGVRHAIMEADLHAYPPCHSPYSGMVLKALRQHRHTDYWPGLFEPQQQVHVCATAKPLPEMTVLREAV